MARQDKRPIRTKKSIKEALLQLVSEKDLSKITVCELVERANISRKTFYLHYKDITDILEEVEMDLVKLLKESLMQDKTVGFRVRLINFINNITRLVENDIYYYSLIAKSRYSKNLFKSLDGIIRQELISAFDNETIMDTVKKQFLVNFITGGIRNTILEWVNMENKPPVEELSSILFEFINNNLTSYLRNYNNQYK